MLFFFFFFLSCGGSIDRVWRGAAREKKKRKLAGIARCGIVWGIPYLSNWVDATDGQDGTGIHITHFGIDGEGQRRTTTATLPILLLGSNRSRIAYSYPVRADRDVRETIDGKEGDLDFFAFLASFFFIWGARFWISLHNYIISL